MNKIIYESKNDMRLATYIEDEGYWIVCVGKHGGDLKRYQ